MLIFKRTSISVGLILSLSFSLLSQQNDLITVRAGTRILDYFPIHTRYRYPEFVPGKVFFHNGTYAAFRLNYSYLVEEMHYVVSRDTMSIINKKDIEFIVMEQDTFLFDKIYLEIIWNKAPLTVALHEYIKLKEIQKKDPYGVASSGSATKSYTNMRTDGNYYRLTVNEDMIFQRVRDYYLAAPGSEFQPYNRKNVLKLFPQYEEDIKIFIKSNDIDFSSREDLFELSEYLQIKAP